jgi:ketosteroid isomerase-like protein
MSRTVRIALAMSLLWLSACASGRDTSHHETAVKATLEAFYGAMKTGDTAMAMAQIAPDAMFVETGKLETREQYEKNHLPLDIGFEKQITGKRTPWRVTIKDDTAWVIASTTYTGPVDGDDVNFVSSQLAVLTNEMDGWRIRSIHWSSRPNLD